jgi:hypothetical protein
MRKLSLLDNKVELNRIETILKYGYLLLMLFTLTGSKMYMTRGHQMVSAALKKMHSLPVTGELT